MDPTVEKECAALSTLFQQIVADMKNSTPVWEDFAAKAMRLHVTLRSTVSAASSFLEAFQKVADMATNTRGATRDIGSALTRLCMRHRNIEMKLKTITGAILEMLAAPLQDRLEDWRKVVIQLDKEHSKESKKAHQEVKKAASETSRLQKKVKKGRTDVQGHLDSAIDDLRQKLFVLQEIEKNAVRAALVEERARYCLFIGAIKPLIDGEVSLISDATHLQEIMDSLCRQATDPSVLPATSEQVIMDLSGSSISSWQCQSPPKSPAVSLTSSKSSLSSLSSASSSQSPSHRARTTSENSAASDTESVEGRSVGSTLPSSPRAIMASSVQSYGRQPHHSSPGHPMRRFEQGSTGQLSALIPYLDGVRPHTISSAYERLHARAALTSQTYEPPPYHLVAAISQPTTPCPNPVLVQHRSLATMAQRSRPHSLSRNIELTDETFLQPARGPAQASSRPEGTQPYHGPDSNTRPDSETEPGVQQQLAAESNWHLKPSDGQPSCIETVKSLTEAIKRLEENARDGSLECSQPGTQRCLQHSISCGTIVADQHPFEGSGKLANGNHTETAEMVARRSSMYVNSKQQQQQQHQQPVRRVLSMVVPVSAIDHAISQYGGDNDNAINQFQGMTQSDIISRSPALLDGMSRSCSALPQEPHFDDDDDDGGFLDDEFLLPPSPFRSPELSGNGPDFDSVLPYRPGSESSTNDAKKDLSSYITAGGGEKDRFGILPMNDQLMRQNSGGSRSAIDGSGNGNFLWMNISSPDDVTPTNENQPQAFGLQGRMVGVDCQMVPPSSSDTGSAEKCTVRYSDL